MKVYSECFSLKLPCYHFHDLVSKPCCFAQEGLGFPSYGLDLTNPDFVKYAESYGARGYRITKVCLHWLVVCNC
jgi:hypothetical protein